MSDIDLGGWCAPEIADSVLKLAQNSPSLPSFLASCSLFVRAPADILTKLYNQTERLNESDQPQLAPQSSEQEAPSTPQTLQESDNDLDRQWYDDEVAIPVPEETIPASATKKLPKHDSDERVHIFYTRKTPPFLSSQPNLLPTLVQIIRDPGGTLNLQAKAGSALVRQHRIDKDRKKIVQTKMAARGTLKSLESHSQVSQRSQTTDSHAQLSYGQLTSIRQSLPAYEAREQILQAVRENQVVIVIGETGSGKTTQIPQFLLEDGYGANGLIGCTQPRRVAAMSVAERVAAERGVVLGSQVGYSIRFEDKTSAETRIKFLTDGILLREALNDPNLDKYSCIIIDEAHERALNTDLLLGLFKRVLVQRRDLRLIITSATINSSLFSHFYGGAPVFTIPGRTHPVHVQNIKSPVEDYVQATIKQVLSIHLQAPPGDILVFMTGQDDIETTCDELEQKLKLLEHPPPLEILPIYSQLPVDLQAKIFLPSSKRKVIVATNIAETSLTVEGVKYVVDSGYTKMKIYQPKYGIDTLQLVPISLANASQRAGRAGRTSEGFAYRIYTKLAEEDEMYQQPVPEILRTNLSNTILLLKSLGVDNINEFDLLDAPNESSINASLHDLWILGALDSNGHLSDLGRRLSLYPMDPFMARLLEASLDLECSEQVLTIVAMMSAPPVFIRSNQRSKESDSAREKYQVPESDHLTLLNVYNEWQRHGRSEAWCKDNFLQSRVLKYAQSIKRQLEKLLFGSLKVKPQSTDDSTVVRKCICMAYFHQAARAKGLQTFVGISTGVEMSLHPTSSLYGLGHIPSFVVYHEVILTSKQFMTVVTAVEPEWLLEYGSVFYSDELPDKVSEKTSTQPDRLSTTVAPRPKFKRRKVDGSSKINKTFMRGV